MKKIMIITLFCFFGALAFVPFTLAASSSHSGHGMDSMNTENVEGKAMDGHAGHDMAKEKNAHAGHDMNAHDNHEMNSEGGKTSHGGDTIHSSMVDGYHFTYKLIDMAAKMKGMKDMPEMKATHHLMLFVKSHGGQIMKTATVGFLIENPDGTLQKMMGMAMAGGYGADVEFSQAGSYTVKMKALVEKDKVMDQFEYEIKAH
ncbi:hypothetical protein SAMN02746065_111107 [Desulfocicer vacuolatum DSM 3385]|uniref:YtkA-like n=1 Tax=Desulfocicer vacuolatum DSM 3385 TaxID=1121400 RepID=A0A1W2CBZ5_9BACT|nr:hypothetical protein [Desulfocicer vacuolatum]SMC82700.1 hypothetical protein SAMN02746065_111107 [Desulfocicer vacuolatum DSM 3385]